MPNNKDFSAKKYSLLTGLHRYLDHSNVKQGENLSLESLHMRLL